MVTWEPSPAPSRFCRMLRVSVRNSQIPPPCCCFPPPLHLSPVKWTEPLTCDRWDCDCTFTRQRGCCCAANDMYALEEETFASLKALWNDVSELGGRVLRHSGDG